MSKYGPVVKHIWRVKNLAENRAEQHAAWTARQTSPTAPNALPIHDPEPHPLLLVCSHDPGTGKTYTAQTISVVQNVHLLSPTHALAEERVIESTIIAKRRTAANAKMDRLLDESDPNLTNLQKSLDMLRASEPSLPAHLQGFGRLCPINPSGKDEWANLGVSFKTAMCGSSATICPQANGCPANKQYWNLGKEKDKKGKIRQSILGTHTMADWQNYNGVQIIDERAAPIDIVTMDIDDLSRYYHRNSIRALDQWITPMSLYIKDVVNCLVNFAHDAKDLEQYQTTLPIYAQFSIGSPQRNSLEAAIEYLQANPMPLPAPRETRMGMITPDMWLNGNLLKVLIGIAHASDGIHILDGDPNRRVNCAFVVEGDSKGNVRSMELQLRAKIVPTLKSTIIFDATADLNKEYYIAMYPQHEVKFFNFKKSVKSKFVTLQHVKSWTYSKSHLLNKLGDFLPKAINPLVRAIQDIRCIAAQLTMPGRGKPKMGLISYKGVVGNLGFDTIDGIFDSTKMPRNTCDHTELENLLVKLSLEANLVVGHHHGTVGSNEFKDCAALVIIGAPCGNIHSLQEEAKTIDIDPNKYIDWLTSGNLFQEIHRARLHSASKTSRKFVICYANTVPDIAGVEWQDGSQRRGGPRLSPAQQDLEVGIYADAGLCGAFWASIRKDMWHLSETRIKGTLQGFRKAGIDWSGASPATNQTFTRLASHAGEVLGYTRFALPNPVGRGQAVLVWARTERAAQQLVGATSRVYGLIPTYQQKELEAKAPEREKNEARETQLIEAREDCKEKITARLQEAKQDTLVARRTGASPDASEIRKERNAVIKLLLLAWHDIREEYKATLTKEQKAAYLPNPPKWIKESVTKHTPRSTNTEPATQ